MSETRAPTTRERQVMDRDQLRAMLRAGEGADLGIMLSASHNPAPDNGIKLFAPGGHKLPV